MSIRDNVEFVLEQVEKAAIRSGRKLSDITVIGATKTQTPDAIDEMVNAGIKIAGENRVQEITQKYDMLKTKPAWHMIGHLQSNKIKYIIDKVELIHSVDSLSLLKEINKHAQRINKVMPVLLQVNVSGEESKFGMKPDEVEGILEQCDGLNNILVSGLMTIPPKQANPNDNILHFCNIFAKYIDIKDKKYNNVSIKHLSMGMSDDYVQAIESGATMVRIGTAVFGERQYKN